MFCRNCGHPINEGASFCGNCGEQVMKTASQVKAPAVQQTGPQAAPPVTPKPLQSQYPQPQYPNPQFRQSAAPAYAPPQPPQTRSNTALLIVIIILLLILVVIGSILLFIKPGYLRQNGGGVQGELTLNSTSESAQTTFISESESTQNTTAAPPITQPPEHETSVITDYPQELIGGNYDPMEDPWALSASERPRLEEFEWCFGQFGLIRQAPENAEYLSDVQSYNGGWKAMIIYDPDDSDGSFTRELDNITISVDQNHAV